MAVSLLDVWVGEDGHGLAAGAFGLVLFTDDGGSTWAPGLDRTGNPKALHLYAIRPVAGEVLVAGEQGLLLRLDRARGRLVSIPAARIGSLFGLVSRGRDVVAFGLGGRALRSGDGGLTWVPVETGIDAALFGGTVLPDGRIVLASQRGDLVASADGGRTFRSAGRGPPAAAIVAVGPDAVVVAGPAGVGRVVLPAEAR